MTHWAFSGLVGWGVLEQAGGGSSSGYPKGEVHSGWALPQGTSWGGSTGYLGGGSARKGTLGVRCGMLRYMGMDFLKNKFELRYRDLVKRRWHSYAGPAADSFSAWC